MEMIQSMNPASISGTRQETPSPAGVSCAAQSQADGTFFRQHLLDKELTAFAQSAAVVGEHDLVHYLGQRHIRDKRWRVDPLLANRVKVFQIGGRGAR